MSERKKLLSFADVAERSGMPSSDVQGFHQPRLEGVDSDEKKEIIIENLVVTRPPQIKKTGLGCEWSCSVSYQQDLWHQENYTDLLLHAARNADTAIALRLKPRDLVQVTGVPWDQQVALRGGKVKTLHHLNVTDIVIMNSDQHKHGGKSERCACSQQFLGDLDCSFPCKGHIRVNVPVRIKHII